MDENCCENPDIKIITGNRTCINCSVVHHPYITHGWIDYNPRNVVLRKSVYSRTAYVKSKIEQLRLSPNETRAFMDVWVIVESRLKIITSKRFPKLEFFISKILENLDIPKQPSYKISDALRQKYEIMWKQIV